MELVFDLFLVALFSGFLFMSQSITEKSISNDYFGSRGFPEMVAIVAIVLLVGIIAKTLVARNKAGYVKPQKVQMEEGYRKIYIRVLSLIMLLFVYIVLLKSLGFVLETVLFIFLALTILGYKKYPISVLFSVAFTAILVIVFGRVFFIAIPRGTGFLREISYFLF
ncbi:tripartite tricarboxylate transporter TctB family protein [Sphaerochaeta sp. PS]|uniref:tripartite tricarboxylate transporter TctB family protein n=1 Tax=Sphaerochaeta sp. PS TaxID=3076336 RepID=UPI0028A3A94E|nr:tripartite tricarboxylate transporter TctB family protein [Sphaerochaeta sp. PS]MDT4762646.1 tripartite tricarboxylate transporter TctB family protein [Sphaerochaeta sp. PS]